MRYDRRVPDALLDQLLPGAPLGWLLPWLDSPDGAGAHLQLRGAPAIAVYLGRTCVLSMGAGGRLQADPRYQSLRPGLFAAPVWDEAGLRDYLGAAAQSAHPSLVGGEAPLQAALLRAAGPFAEAGADWVALDAELRVAYPSAAARAAFEAALPARLGLPAGAAVPRKLDILGLDQRGALLLIEVKRGPMGLDRAAWQAAVHVARTRALIAAQPDLGHVLAEQAAARARVGLLGAATPPAWSGELAPVIAAADPGPRWEARWRQALAPVLAATGDLLDGLRLWRLDRQGARIQVA